MYSFLPSICLVNLRLPNIKELFALCHTVSKVCQQSSTTTSPLAKTKTPSLRPDFLPELSLDGKWEMGNGKWEMGNGKWEECRKTLSSFTLMPQQAGPIILPPGIHIRNQPIRQS
jgi:hypothetical protein